MAASNLKKRKRLLPETNEWLNTKEMTYNDVLSTLECVRKDIDSRLDRICDLQGNDKKLVEEIRGQQDRLRIIAESVGLCRIGFYGQRGAGKTTMINRLLGLDDCELLPTGENTAITASISEIQGWDKAFYSAIVTFITRDEWTDFVNDVKSDISEDADIAEQPRYKSFDQQLASMYRNVEKTRYDTLRRQDDFGSYGWQMEEDPFDLLPNDVKQLVQKGYTVIQNDFVEGLADDLVPFTFRAQRFWPIVCKISISGPFETLNKYKAMLVDLPGTDDGDYMLTRRFESGQQMCDRLFYLPGQSVMLSAQTANECVHFRSLTCEFGTIFPKIDTLMRNRLYRAELKSVDDMERFVREKISEYYLALQPQALKRFQSIKIYPVENDPELLRNKPEYRKLLENFINYELASARPKESKVVQNYVASANHFFSSLLTRLGIVDVQPMLLIREKILAIRPPRSNLDGFVAEWRAEFVGQTVFEKLPQLVSAELQSWHYKKIQALLRSRDSQARMALARFIISLCLNADMIESIEAELEKNLSKQRSYWVAMIGAENLDNTKSLFQAINSCITYDKTNFWWFCFYKAADHIYSYFMRKTFPEALRGANAKAFMTAKFQEFLTQQISELKDELATSIINQVLLMLSNFSRSLTEYVHHSFMNIADPIQDPSDNLRRLLEPIQLTVVKKFCVSNGLTAFGTDSGLSGPERNLMTFVNEHSDVLTQPSLNDRLFRNRGTSAYVYVFSNVAYKGDMLKIGFANDVERRRKDLFKTGVPMEFRIEKTWLSDDALSFERLMHMCLEKLRVNHRREFFHKISMEVIFKLGDLILAVEKHSRLK